LSIKNVVDVVDKSINEYMAKVPGIQKKIYSEILTLTKELKLDSRGNIKNTIDNYRLLNNLRSRLSKVIFTSDYQKTTQQLVNSYDDCGNIIAPTSTDGLAYWAYQTTADRAADHYRNGESMGRFFGAGGDNNCLGYYKIDAATSQIRFSQLAQRVGIVLEYLADINAVDQDFEVHPFCIEALKDYIFWKYKLRSNKPLGETDMAHDIYKKSYNLMQRMFRSNTADEWISAFQSGNFATPKM